MRLRIAFSLLALTLWAIHALPANAQQTTEQTVIVPSAPPEAAPDSPAVSPGPLSLEQCIDLGFQYQPALDAARASVSATYAGKRGVDRLKFAAILVRDLNIRRQQACQGVTIAEAALMQAEWE